jgi:hypothetical protein
MVNGQQQPAHLALEYASMAVGCIADVDTTTHAKLQNMFGKRLYPDITSASNNTSSSSTSSSSNQELQVEYAAAFPLGFLQEEPAATPAAAPSSHRPTGEVAKQVRFADELQARQQRAYEASKPRLVAQLQQLIHNHNVRPGQSNTTGLMAINSKLRAGKRFVLDRFLNDTPQTGYTLLLPNGECVQGDTKVDTGASSTLANRRWAEQNGIRFYPTSVQLRLADSSLGRVAGITEPMWGVVAAGTRHQATAMLQALVIDNAPDVFELLTAKDHLHDLNAWVMPRDQLFSYQTDAGHRHTVPVECYHNTEIGAVGMAQPAVLSGSYALANPEDLPQAIADFWANYEGPMGPATGPELAGCPTASSSAEGNPQLADYTMLPTEYAFMGLSGLDFDSYFSSPLTAATGQASATVAPSPFTTATGHHAGNPVQLLRAEGHPGECGTEAESGLGAGAGFEAGTGGHWSSQSHHTGSPSDRWSPGDTGSLSQLESLSRTESTINCETGIELGDGELTCTLLSSCERVELGLFYECNPAAITAYNTQQPTPVFPHMPATPPVTCFIAVANTETGGVQLEIYYDFTVPQLPVMGRAACLAAAAGAGSQTVPPSQTPSRPAQAKRCTAGAVLKDAGFEAPPFYYRTVAALATWTASLLFTFFGLLMAATIVVIPWDPRLLRQWLNWYVERLYRWWLLVNTPVPDFLLPRLVGRRSRKKARPSWILDWVSYRRRGKLLTSSLRRHAKRFWLARRQYERATTTHFAATLATGISTWALMPLVLLTITSILATAMATPDTVTGLHGMTNNLAAWELSHLAGWRFLGGRLLQRHCQQKGLRACRFRCRQPPISQVRGHCPRRPVP